MDDLRGKVAVVTGAASGIGLAMSKRFAAAGMRVVMADIEAPALDAAAGSVAGETQPVVTDVSKAAQVEALRDAALDRFGAVHVVCNNAGVAVGGALIDVTLADWEWVLGVNLWGVVHGVQAFLPLLLAQDEGHFVNTASMAGLVSMPMMGPYTVSKHGVVALSETLVKELGLRGSKVGVSVLCPGWVNTRIGESDRNRPADLPGESLDEASPLTGLLRSVLANGLAPEAVADAVHDAVVGNRFYILTHPEMTPAVGDRMQAILDGRSPDTSGADLAAFLH